MQARLRIKRFNPDDADSGPRFQEYALEVDDVSTVLDAVIKVREEIDGTLAVRYSCRSSICGSCGMRINGRARLGCKTRVKDLAPNGETVTVEPMGNMRAIKDLITDFKPFWEKVRAVEPYLQPTGPEPEAEYIASNEVMIHLVGVGSCIMCGCCVSDCTVLAVDDSFLGPAALAKAYRFVADPRDGKQRARLEALNDPTGFWDCTRCMQCVEVCPKNIAPMPRIMAMRDLAMAAGYENTPGARHTKSFADSVKKSGRLNETKLAIETIGYGDIRGQIAMAPIGLAALRRGKFPSPLGHKIPARKAVARIFKKVEGEQ